MRSMSSEEMTMSNRRPLSARDVAGHLAHVCIKAAFFVAWLCVLSYALYAAYAAIVFSL